MTDPRTVKSLPFMIQYIFSDSPFDFINFIEEVFDAEEVRERSVTDGMLLNAMYKIAGSLYEISQARGEFKQVTMSYHLYTSDMETILENAEAFGSEIKYRSEKMDYGDLESWFIDPFGNNWFLATYIGE